VKIRIEIVESIEDEEVIIRCRELTDSVMSLQKVLAEKTARLPEMVFHKGKDEYYFPLTNILFFATDDDTVYAHTDNETYRSEYRLYELEKVLPPQFVRVSKSTIVNIKHILSISKNLASSSLIKFHGSHKQIYVSRLYYKELKQRLSERSS
jgi:DNA-binding LytR/AlgR family response regulator